jgi:ABC-2 type transport system ATP-binding protein
LAGHELRRRFVAKGRPDVVALDGVSLRVGPGSLSALVGPDGSGKTTLLRMAAGLVRPDSGTLNVLGIDVVSDPQRVQDRISYMPQRFGLYDDLSVQENLDLYADLHGVPALERAARYRRLLQMTDLARFTERPAGKLSGGMKQKLGLACTLVRSPELLLLDEPTVGVDPLSRRELWQIVQQLVDDEKLTVLLSTAYLDEAERCHHVFLMRGGRMLAEGPPQTLRDRAKDLCFAAAAPTGRPARWLQARLLDDVARIADAVPQSGEVRFIRRPGQELASPPAVLDGLAVRPVPPRLEDGFMVLLGGSSGAVAPTSTSTPASAPSASRSAAPAAGASPDPAGVDAERGRAGARSTAEPPGAGANDDDIVIEVHDLVRTFGDFTAVSHISFSVRRGEVFGLLGPNGAGKTTTFRMLCGLLPATSGQLRVAGVDLRTAPAAARRHIGYVAQKFALYGTLSVLENLRFFCGAYGLRGGRARERIREVLGQFGLSEQQATPSGQLAGGFRQRLAMAAALLHEPQILFLDEPTSGADPRARREFWRRITDLAEQGTTIVITTHFMEEAEYCDRIVIQDAGRMLALGTPAEVRQQAGSNDADRAGTGAGLGMEQAFMAIVEHARARSDIAAEAGGVARKAA